MSPREGELTHAVVARDLNASHDKAFSMSRGTGGHSERARTEGALTSLDMGYVGRANRYAYFVFHPPAPDLNNMEYCKLSDDAVRQTVGRGPVRINNQ